MWLSTLDIEKKDERKLHTMEMNNELLEDIK